MPNPKGLSIRLKIPTRVQPEVVPPPGRAGEYTNKIHHMNKYLLEELCQQEFALPFMEPVDTKALNVPTYYTIIEHPMDVGTIIMRVENRYYRSVHELINDVRLVIRNCFTFNMPEATVYRDGQKLEKLFLKVLEKLPTGEEVPYDKDKAEKSIMKRQCRYRLRKLQEHTDQMEQDGQELFREKWMPFAEEMHKRNIKTLEDFDSQLDNILKHCHDHGKRILESYEHEANRLIEDEESGDNENVSDEAGSNMWPCHKPLFDWEDTIIDALDDTLICLKQDVVKCRLGEHKKNKQSYSEILLPIFVNAQIISEGLCSQTNLPDSSDEEEIEWHPDRVSDKERHAIRQQFSSLIPEAIFDIMHIIEQAEYRTASNADRKYNMMYFSPQTIVLIKKAIEAQNKASLKHEKEQQDVEMHGEQQDPGELDNIRDQNLYYTKTNTDFVGHNNHIGEYKEQYAGGNRLEQHQQAIPIYYLSLPEADQQKVEENIMRVLDDSRGGMEWEVLSDCDSDADENDCKDNANSGCDDNGNDCDDNESYDCDSNENDDCDSNENEGDDDENNYCATNMNEDCESNENDDCDSNENGECDSNENDECDSNENDECDINENDDGYSNENDGCDSNENDECDSNENNDCDSNENDDCDSDINNDCDPNENDYSSDGEIDGQPSSHAYAQYNNVTHSYYH
ncbi:bromodomain-containing protein DDB_G0270170 isoform X1 [Drosophila virilis]|uniref:Bromo domain-containing protein n=1 Tax=Drosophila virilis TaxID=7244 RepID=B4LM61_DROVI|nr:putative uncharacterized protein DDB_G0282133 [Drosophila virilis]EDW60939.2 uncharacterized protein Dvir_GJ20583 [Drosophila virilis]